MLRLRQQDRLRRTFAVVGIGAFFGYAIWNIAWLSMSRIPPSILVEATGLPCPTTGMTRSVMSLLHGDMAGFICYNPFTGIYLALIVLSAAALAVRVRRGESLAIPAGLGWCWFIALGGGWVAKFVLGATYW